MKDERGEIATLLTIGTLVVIGVTAVVSSLFVNKPQTTGTRAAAACSAGTYVGKLGGVDYWSCAAGCGKASNGACLTYQHNSPDQTCASCNSTGGGSGGGAFEFSCSYNEKIVGEATQCTAAAACGSSEVVGDKVDTENAKRHCCCKPASSGTHDPACTIPASGSCPSSCANGCEACSAPDSSFKKCKAGSSYPDPNCGSYTMRQGAGDCYTICQGNNETYVNIMTTDGTTGHKCCCKPAGGADANCNTTKTYCTNQCAGNTDSSRGYYAGKADKANKYYESSGCSGTELDLSKFCCKGAGLCGGAIAENMCPDGNEVRNQCIGTISGKYKCCGPHDNKEFPTANYATWNSTGTCGGATGLENLPAGCCFKDSDCDKYGSGQKCNIPNGACGGAGGLSCNANKDGKYQQQCVNQQCVNQPCDAGGCDPNKYCADNSKCQQQYGGFTCPEKDTGNNGQAVYSWADSGTKCVCMNCKVYGNAPNYTCGSDTQNNYDGSLCCQKEPAKSGAACSAYNQNTCGIKDKPCCTGAGINPCKTDDLTCDASNTCKPKISATTCTTTKDGDIPRDGKTHCLPKVGAKAFGMCVDGKPAAYETECAADGGTCEKGYGQNGGDGCNKGYYSQCDTSVAGKRIANDGKTHCIDNDTFGRCEAGKAKETDCETNLVCSDTQYGNGTEAGCIKPGTTTGGTTGSCNGQGTPCNTYCKNTDANKPNAQYSSRNYWYASNTYSSDYSGTCTAYNKAEDICGTCSATAAGNGETATDCKTGNHTSRDCIGFACPTDYGNHKKYYIDTNTGNNPVYFYRDDCTKFAADSTERSKQINEYCQCSQRTRDIDNGGNGIIYQPSDCGTCSSTCGGVYKYDVGACQQSATVINRCCRTSNVGPNPDITQPAKIVIQNGCDTAVTLLTWRFGLIQNWLNLDGKRVEPNQTSEISWQGANGVSCADYGFLGYSVRGYTHSGDGFNEISCYNGGASVINLRGNYYCGL